VIWKEKYKTDPAFYALVCCRRRVSNLIKSKGINAPYRTLELLGCSADFFMNHIESQFKTGMSWDNAGKWEIDHIRPCASFDFNDPEQQKECFHYSNQRPMWKKKNRQKRDAWDGQLDMTQTLLGHSIVHVPRARPKHYKHSEKFILKQISRVL
jgi:hypothetical protein